MLVGDQCPALVIRGEHAARRSCVRGVAVSCTLLIDTKATVNAVIAGQTTFTFPCRFHAVRCLRRHKESACGRPRWLVWLLPPTAVPVCERCAINNAPTRTRQRTSGWRAITRHLLSPTAERLACCGRPECRPSRVNSRVKSFTALLTHSTSVTCTCTTHCLRERESVTSTEV